MVVELNGWNTEAMNEAIEGVKECPEAGILTWRSRVKWDGGYGLDVRTREIEQLDEVMVRRFTMRGDHPPELLGNNTGPTAVEILMSALGACMAGTFAAQATAREVKIDKLEVDLESKIDINGMFGLMPIRPGLSDVKLSFRVESDADMTVLQEILEEAQALSPVFDSVTKPVEVNVDLEKTEMIHSD
ncbi:MAG: OsmC family protein [Balneolaceae bacterium]|jgi:uncharacterized OsmC-like protein